MREAVFVMRGGSALARKIFGSAHGGARVLLLMLFDGLVS